MCMCVPAHTSLFYGFFSFGEVQPCSTKQFTPQALAWQSDNRCSVGDLWLQLLKFYCLHFDYTHVVVSLRYAKVLTRLEKKWHAKKFTVEG